MKTVTPVEARQKLLKLEEALNEDLVDRQYPIKTLVNALVSRRHHFQLGSPGIAKSALIERAHLYISGAKYFHWLLTKFTAPEELFGPISLQAMENDVFRHNTAAKLPEADLAFLDEVWKCNSAILNSLLTVVNERLFFNDAEPTPIPLSSLFAASNEMPEGEELTAMYDRLDFRHVVTPVVSSSSFMKILNLRWDPHPDPVISWDEIKVAQQAAELVEVPTDVKEAMRELWQLLKRDGIEPTDRRFRQCQGIIQAASYLAGRDVAEIDDMNVLQHCLWARPEDIPTVVRHVISLANPLDKKAQDILERVEAIAQGIDKAIQSADSPSQLARQTVEYFNKLVRAKNEIQTLKGEYQAAHRNSDIFRDLTKRYNEVKDVLEDKCINVRKLSGLDGVQDA